MTRRPDAACLSALILLSVALWLPRLRGPIDLRYDAGIHYILGTSLAEGKGYRLLNEPGEIEAIQYPPLLPLFAAAHQLLAGSTDPAVAGYWLRLSFFALFIAFVVASYVLCRRYLPPPLAFLAVLVSISNLNMIFLSDLFFAEIPFALTTTLCVLFAHGSSRRLNWLAGFFGVVSYLLRTIGIALLAAWVGESLIRRRFREVALRTAVALLPVLAWQGYIATVKGGARYQEPVYLYQRADYQVHNVGYPENILYVDPNAPELGRVSPQDLTNRVVNNLSDIPRLLGESVSTATNWWQANLIQFNKKLPSLPLPLWLAPATTLLIGCLIFCGLILLASRGHWLVPLYVFASVAVMCLTPWPEQFWRYLLPLNPFLALALFYLLVAGQQYISRTLPHRFRMLGALTPVFVAFAILVQQSSILVLAFTRLHQPVIYQDGRGEQREYRVFFYDEAWRSHDAALAWLRGQANSEDVVATLTPHWAFLKTGLKTVMPPLESDVTAAQSMIGAVPVTYLILDDLKNAGVATRYAAPIVRAFPKRWDLVHSALPSGSRIYRRVNPATAVVHIDRLSNSRIPE